MQPSHTLPQISAHPVGASAESPPLSRAPFGPRIVFIWNIDKSNLWNGAIFSYMMYSLGPTAIQQLGRRQFLALYLLGGAFSQRKIAPRKR